MTSAPMWVPVLVLLALLLLAYLAMWRGWRRRGRRHDLPALVPVDGSTAARLQAGGRYLGSTTNGDWLDRVVARGLGTRSTCGLSLSDEGLDVLRPGGPFRVPAEALRGARRDQGIAGKVLPPHGVLVVTWQHGDLLLDSGFRLDPAASPAHPSEGGSAASGSRSDSSVRGLHEAWVEAIEKMVKESAA